MRKQSIVEASEDSEGIDLTPMLDVVFILLIFFIVTATFIKEPGIDVSKPIALTSNTISNQSILIAISSTGDIWLDKKVIEAHHIRAEIEKMHAENPKGAVVIQADLEARAEKLAVVIDAAKHAGVENISLATIK